MQLLQGLHPVARPGSQNRDAESTRSHFPVNLLFAVIVLLSDNMMAALEFSTVGVACIASVFLAMCLFPVGVLLQRFGATRHSWPLSVGISAGVCTLVAIPTSFGTLIPGAVVLITQLASRARAAGTRDVTNSPN